METSARPGPIGFEAGTPTPCDPPLYPIALKLAGERCLVVGGGVIALRKAQDLLRCGGQVHVVAPEWRADFTELDGEPGLTRSTRAFEPSDLEGARVVVAATDEPAVQEVVAREASARNVPCNVVDVNHLCTFYVPAVLRRGSLTVAVGTEGKFPLLAQALRDRIAESLGAGIAPALDKLAEGRAVAFSRHPQGGEERLAALKRLLTPQAVEWIVTGRTADFDSHFEAWKETL